MGGDPIPDGGVFFHGGSGANPDEIELENSSSITAITYSFTNANDGSIDLDGSTITFTGLELPIDYGDAPDTGAGTGGGNYQTLQSDTGPGHTIVTGLFLGATVDGDDGTLQNATANADDVDGVLPDNEPDDEDGVLSPLDLLGTIGAAPTITLLATNRSSNVATLSGWIDYNNDGVFDNATERAQVTVPAGTTDDRFTLTFPSIPTDTAGATYARFRLSTDAAAANSTGAASDGEVEDHVFSITTASDSTVDHFLKIASDTNGGPTLDDGVEFGSAVASIGDLDGDGVTDLAVGAYDDTTGGTSRGAVHVLFMNNDGSVKSSTKIASDTNGGPTLADFGGFGGRSGR
ncbi:MAG: integrin alpha [Fuerstiella sp.]